jgi:hypothetical protein
VNFAKVDRAGALAIIGTMIGGAKWDWSGGMHGVHDVIDGGETFAAIDHAGKPVVVFVLSKVDNEGGRELVIRAALQVGPGRDLVETVLPEIERTFGGDCDAMMIYTKRGGLVRKLQRAGYHDAATIMRKNLK